MYRRLAGLPLGRWLFARVICLRAPYFASVSPLLRDLRPGRAEVSMRKRRRVLNHIGTVHALAMGNLCEFAAGLVMEATLPTGMRWIPRGMNIEYLRKAQTDLTAVATLAERSWAVSEDVPVQVSVVDGSEQEVVSAVIRMYVSPAR
jgi:acyl-coenzyme A thioesterase PaaI-like protein